MTVQSLLAEPGRIDEPQAARDYSQVLSQVASEGKPVIVRRNGEDLAAVIPLEQLDLVREILAREQVETLAMRINWLQPRQIRQPPPEWFNDTDNPFEPEQETAP